MLFKTFLTLLAVGVALCDPEKCSSRLEEVCNLDQFPRDYPDTVEELKQNCNDLQEILRCIINFFEDCSRPTIEIDMFETLLKYVEEKCDENSHAFKVISSNLGCVSTTARTFQEKCSIDNLSDEDIDIYRNLQEHLAENNGHMCIRAYRDIICYSHVMGLGCGSEVKDVAADILENTNLNFRACDTADLSDFLPLKEFIESKFGEDNIIGNIIGDEA